MHAERTATRVRAAQQAARDGLVLCGAFVVAAVVAAAAGAGPDHRWLALHLLLAGGVVAAIGGASVLFVVTWSAAPAPPRRLTRAQLGLAGVGAAGVAASRTLEWPTAALAAFATAFAAGLAVLAVTLVVTVRRGSQRRYDVATAWYVTALAAGLAGAALGAAIGTGHAPAGGRDAHVALNLLGLVGLVIGGTLPSFAATTARTKVPARASARRRAVLLGWQAASVAAAVAGAVKEVDALAAAGLAGYAAGIVVVAWMLPRPDAKQRAYAGPRLLGLHAGVAWWAVAVVVAAGRAAGGSSPLEGRTVAVLAVAGYAQIVWASAAYLVPVVRAGGHQVLSASFATTRSWTVLAAANAAGVLLTLGATGWAVAVLAVAAAEAVGRHAVVLAKREPGGTPSPS